MATAASDAKVLRIGVIQGGKVIEERVVRKRGPVTFGTDDKNTFVLTGGDLPKSWALFDLKGQNYQLVFSDQMQGRVSVEAADVDFAGLKAQNLAEKTGDRYRMTLSESSRGRVQFGPELTILFHFVAAPPIAPKPELPMSVKGGIIKAIEPIFTSVLVGSFLVHMAVVVMVKTVDPPPPPSVEDLRRVIERITPPKVEVPTIPVESTGPVVAGNGPGTEGKKEPKKGGGDKGDGDGGGGAPKGGGGKGKGGGGGAGPDRGAIRDAIAGKGILAMIGARGGGGGDVGSALAGTAGVGVYGGGGGDITRRGGGGGGGGGPGGGGGGAAGIGDLATSGGGSVDTGAKAAARIVARVSTDDTQAVDGGNFDKKAITAAIKRRQDAFQDCYQSALKQNSKLAGKIVVEFTIAEDGRVTDTRINKSTMGSAEVEKCLQGVLRRMRFPAQKEEVTLSNSFVFQASGS